MGLFSLKETLLYQKTNQSTDYRILAASPYSPSVSIIAPAYNEGNTIVENVRSLLNIYYNNLDIIVVNDGSVDNTLSQLIDVFELEKANQYLHGNLITATVRQVYKSENPVYKKLIVVDKENGGKADALNAGINLSDKQFIISIDVDCILAEDALLKIIKPILEAPPGTVIAVGGVVRISNSCSVQHGRLLRVNFPTNLLAGTQVLEYMRAFLLGRMAWSRFNGLLLISGAFGAFDRELIVKCGGYDVSTIGEDMELVVRMRRYMQERNLPYEVKYIPDPLCWTEAPYSFEILYKQRNRWMRGALQTLSRHSIVFFNPRYAIMGMISYPFWVIFEVLGPLLEGVGFILFLSGALFGIIKWKFFFIILGLSISVGYLYSIFSIFMEVMTYNQYRRRSDILKLIGVALLEPFIFHPIVLSASIGGIIDFLRKKRKWGTMKRRGFDRTLLNISQS